MFRTIRAFPIRSAVLILAFLLGIETTWVMARDYSENPLTLFTGIVMFVGCICLWAATLHLRVNGPLKYDSRRSDWRAIATICAFFGILIPPLIYLLIRSDGGIALYKSQDGNLCVEDVGTFRMLPWHHPIRREVHTISTEAWTRKIDGWASAESTDSQGTWVSVRFVGTYTMGTNGQLRSFAIARKTTNLWLILKEGAREAAQHSVERTLATITLQEMADCAKPPYSCKMTIVQSDLGDLPLSLTEVTIAEIIIARQLK